MNKKHCDKSKKLSIEIKKLYEEYNNMSLMERTILKGKRIEEQIEFKIKEIKNLDKGYTKYYKNSLYGNYQEN
jgi:hypothetical protein